MSERQSDDGRVEEDVSFAPFQSPVDDKQLGVPSSARYVVLGFACSMSVLLYLHRFSLSLVSVPMMDELGMDEKDLGKATAWFFYTYALTQVPAGSLSDRLGARWTLTLYVLLWSLAIMGMGLIQGVLSLIVCRALLGLAQAGAYPCIASVNKRWFPPQQRGLANSVTTMGGRAGSLLNSLVTVFLMTSIGAWLGWETGQWRVLFLLYGSLGIIWAVLFSSWFRNDPYSHPACNNAEVELIAPTSLDSRPAVQSRQPLWLVLLRCAGSPSLYFLCGISIFVNVGWIFLVTFYAVYLEKVHGWARSDLGILTAVPLLASMCGGVAGGLTTDALVRRVGLTWGRRLPGIIGSSGAACAYLASLLSDDPKIQIALFAIAGFLIDFGLGALWAVFQDIGGKSVAAVLGFTNMCGNFAAGVFSERIGGFAKAGEWPLVFRWSATALVITALCWLFVNPQRKLTADD
jgi:sugar phosphate permease